jgi:hypothetical protein
MADGIYRIHLDGRWLLEDFYQLPHVFAQLYSFHYAFRGEDEIADIERLAHAFSSYPWQGGYSALNFYHVLYSQVPHGLRPDVKSVRYASPGWLDVQLLAEAAYEVGKAVGVVATATYVAAKAYNEIQKGLRDRELLRIKAERSRMRLARDELEFIESASRRLSNLVGFKNLPHLNKLTNNPLASLKILMSYYRRIRTLVEFVKDGKATFPEGED